MWPLHRFMNYLWLPLHWFFEIQSSILVILSTVREDAVRLPCRRKHEKLFHCFIQFWNLIHSIHCNLNISSDFVREEPSRTKSNEIFNICGIRMIHDKINIVPEVWGCRNFWWWPTEEILWKFRVPRFFLLLSSHV